MSENIKTQMEEFTLPTEILNLDLSFEAIGFYTFLTAHENPFHFSYDDYKRPYYIEQLAHDLQVVCLVDLNYNSKHKLVQIYTYLPKQLK